MNLDVALRYAEGVRKNYENDKFDDLPYGVQALLTLALVVNDLQERPAEAFLQEVDDELAEDLNLDPYPWVNELGSRAKYSHYLSSDYRVWFDPRPKYEQNIDEYDEGFE